MKRRAACLALLALLALPLLAPAGVARAQAESGAGAARQDPIDLEEVEQDRRARMALYPVRARISRYLESAAKSVDAGKPEEALATLARLNLKRRELRSRRALRS